MFFFKLNKEYFEYVVAGLDKSGVDALTLAGFLNDIDVSKLVARTNAPTGILAAFFPKLTVSCPTF